MDAINANKHIKVIVDTNAINNRSIGNGIFGNHAAIEKVIDMIDLYVPEIVLAEIKEHKRRAFNEAKKAIITSGIGKYLGVDARSLEGISVSQLIEEDINSETAPYKIIGIGDAEQFIEKYAPLAIRNMPPFQKETDKGIKDALVAASTEKLLVDCRDDEKLLLVTGDARLAEYFSKKQ